jgi:hypothetical protein
MSEFQSQESRIVQCAATQPKLWDRRDEKGREGRIGKQGKQHNRGSTFSVENNDIPTYLCEQALT